MGGRGRVVWFSGSYTSFIWGGLWLNFICSNAYRREISICFFPLESPPCCLLLLLLPLQTARLLEFIHLSCISLEQVISRPICKYLYRVFPFQLRAGWRSEHKLHLLQHILMGWINTRDQVRRAGSQQGQISTPVMNSFRSLNHSYLHYSTVKRTLFSDSAAKHILREKTFLSELSLINSLGIFPQR